ncbi:uncharacterized protein LOC119671374 isoform X2 [Teleopsis dalmanni]|uniref:uncharacterized protein LOC119671374 isoform X2 n=1 Tax=Teleopsis dalmanni TaxID=139649 RepID=UPI0018CFC964|nr:uncharacterized protein LOC119671374 isoform X2 [Teleopsis dalmanni]
MRFFILLLIFAIATSGLNVSEGKRRIKRGSSDSLANNTKLSHDFVQLRNDMTKNIAPQEADSGATNTKKETKDVISTDKVDPIATIESPIDSVTNINENDASSLSCFNGQQDDLQTLTEEHDTNSVDTKTSNTASVKQRNSGNPAYNNNAVPKNPFNDFANKGFIDNKNNNRRASASIIVINRKTAAIPETPRAFRKPAEIRIPHPNLVKITETSMQNHQDAKKPEGVNTDEEKINTDTVDKTGNNDADNDFDRLVLGKGSLNKQQVPAQAFLQQQPVVHGGNNLTPVDSVVKLANLFLSKMGVDNVPLQTQGAQFSFSPINANTMEQNDLNDFIYRAVDPGFNVRSGSFILPSAGIPATGQIQTAVAYAPPFLMPPPYNAMMGNEPLKPFNMLENALDSFLNTPSEEENNDDEFELRCPVHIERKSLGDGTCGTEDADPKNNVIQVCACRFVKKKKNN